MNWIRTILDGLAMAAYFNLFAAAAALYRPRLLFPCYPPAIIKASKEPPRSGKVPDIGGGSSLGNGFRWCFTAPSAQWRAEQMDFGGWL